MKDYKMRRSQRQISEEEAKKLLEIGSYGVLSTVGEDGYPYGVPVNYVFDGEKIYFHCAKDAGHKQENLNFSDKVSFTAVISEKVIPHKLTTLYQSVIVFGTAKKTEKNKRGALELLAKKYAPDFPDEGRVEIDKAIGAADIYEISIEKISGKTNNNG